MNGSGLYASDSINCLEQKFRDGETRSTDLMLEVLNFTNEKWMVLSQSLQTKSADEGKILVHYIKYSDFSMAASSFHSGKTEMYIVISESKI